MKNLIPEFIAENYKLKNYHGLSNGVALFLDVVGFTAMTEQLMRSEGKGLEPLSIIINNLFTALIASVYNNHGFVFQFAGDSFSAIFLNEHDNNAATNAAKACLDIQEVFKIQALHRTRLGYFTLSAKVGIASGDIEWGILGDKENKTFYFKGSAITKSILAEQNANPGEIICEASYINLNVPNLKTKKLSTDFLLIENNDNLNISSLITTNEMRPYKMEEEVVSRFIPKIVYSRDYEGEFRNAVCVFISIREELDNKKRNEIIVYIMNRTYDVNGYFNSLDFGDKGCTILIVFGAPFTQEYDRIKASQFCLELLKTYNEDIRIAINYGTVYAGFIGSDFRSIYTVLGNVVNQCARLMMAVPLGKIFILESMYKYLSTLNEYEILFIGEQTFKGVPQALPVYELVCQKIRSSIQEKTSTLFGRTNELLEIKNLIQNYLKDKQGALVYFYGGAGCGKTRLLQEIYNQNKDKVQFDFIYAEPIFQKSFGPFIIYLKDFFSINQITEHTERSFLNEIQDFMKAYGKEPNEKKEIVIKNFERLLPYLAILLDIQLNEEKYGNVTLDSYEEKVIEVLVYFFIIKAWAKSYILIIEDIHFLDTESQHFLEKLIQNANENNLLLFLSSRYTDKGDVYKIEMQDNALHSKLEVRSHTLDQLELEAVKLFIEEKLGASCSQTLFDFIVNRTACNAFYIVQFCHYLKSDDLLIVKDGKLDVKNNAINIPEGINTILISRLDRLSTNLRKVLLYAAILGYTFNIRVLKEIIDDKNANKDFQNVLLEGISEQLWMKQSDEVYRFGNEMLRLVAYNIQLNEKIKKHHAKIAKTLIKFYASYQNHDEEIAYHFEKANYIDSAREYYYNAASFATEHYHLNRALIFYDKLLTLSRHENEREALYEKKIEFLELTGKIEKAIELVSTWNQEAIKDSQIYKIYNTNIQLGELYQKSGDNDKAIEVLSKTLKDVEGVKDNQNQIEKENQQTIMKRALRSLGRAYWYKGMYSVALESLNRSLIDGDRDKKSLALTLYYMGVVYRDTGHFDKALKCYHESYDVFSAIGDRFYFTYTLHDLGILSLFQGETRRARNYFEQTEKICYRTGYRLGLAIVKMYLGIIERRRGNVDISIEELNTALKIAQELKDTYTQAMILLQLGLSYFQKDETEMHINFLKKSFFLMQNCKARGCYGYIFSHMAYIYTTKGKFLMALRSILNQFQNIKFLNGIDCEYGLAHLSMAKLLSEKNNFKDEINSNNPDAHKEKENLLEQIQLLSKLTLEPIPFFEEALTISQKNNYVYTASLVMYEYSNYLRKSGLDHEKAVFLFKNAEEISIKSNFDYMVKKFSQ